MNYTPEEKKQIVTALQRLSSFARKGLNKEELLIWLGGIDDAPVKFPASDWIEAIKLCAYSSEDFPTLGKLYESIKKKKNLDSKSLAEQAWVDVMDWIARWSIHSTYDFEIEIERAVRAVGGWSVLRTTEGVNLDFKKKEFIRFYESNVENDSHMQLEAASKNLLLEDK